MKKFEKIIDAMNKLGDEDCYKLGRFLVKEENVKGNEGVVANLLQGIDDGYWDKYNNS